jgi:hypothetical protein
LLPCLLDFQRWLHRPRPSRSLSRRSTIPRSWRPLLPFRGGMSNIQVSMSSMQLEVHSINLRVEQNQLDLQECLKFHHPSSSDDEDDADRTLPLPEDV